MVQQRLLDIAIREFAAKGLEGASTRSIATAAGTAMSSITYHYGGKDGLYLAVADRIAEEMGDMAADFGTESIICDGEPGVARATIHAILAHMVDRMGSPADEALSLFIVREQIQPTEAFDRIYAGSMGRMFDALVELVCVASKGTGRERSRIATLTLFGQVLMLRAGRATCARLLDADPEDTAVLDQFKYRIASNVDAILDAMTAEAANDTQGHS